MDTQNATYQNMIFGDWTIATLPVAGPDNAGRYAYVTDRPGTPGNMVSNGVSWSIPSKRTDTYSGSTNASGDYTVTFSPVFAAIPHVNPVIYPVGDSVTRVRVTNVSASGFTVKTEKNASLSVLGLDVLGLGTVNVPSIAVRVLVVES